MEKVFKKYEEYKESWVEWIGKIPKGWEVKRLKKLFTFQSWDGFPEKLQWKNWDIPFFKVSDINWIDRYVKDSNNSVSITTIRDKKWHLVPIWSVLFAKIGAALSKNHRKINSIECCIDNNISAAIAKQNVNKQFSYWLLRMLDFWTIQNVSAVPSIDMALLRNYSVPISTDMIEQQKIAEYLDREVWQIDKTIEVEEQMIAKYQMLKTSLIHETVVGRNKDVTNATEFVDSWIEWIGKVPKAWWLDKIGKIYSIAMWNTILTDDLVDNWRIPVYSATELDSFFWFVNEARVLLKKWDIVIPARWSIWHVKIVNEDATSTQTTIYAKKKVELIDKYTYWFLLWHKNDIFTFDKTTVPMITCLQVRAKKMLRPSIEDQCDIVEYLDKEVSKIEKIIETLQEMIKKQKELRISLINNVVTWKIKVSE